MQIDPIQPPGWVAPKGYSNGMLVTGGGSMLFIAGQVAWDAQQQLVGEGDFVRQFTKSLENVASVLTEAGGRVEHIVRMTLYLTDCATYLDCQKEVGAAYRSIMGKHFPAMSAVQVAALLMSPSVSMSIRVASPSV